MTTLTFSSLPSLGNIDAYIKAANGMPMLTPDEEQQYARRWRDSQDTESAGRLVLSHLRLVIATARQYLGYGLSHADLIQEGSIGLMKAVKRFDPDKGVRLVTYAMHWIKAEIHEYVLKNFRIVKMATTKDQRKLFFNLRAMRHQLERQPVGENEDLSFGNSLSVAHADAIAHKLGVERFDVFEMDVRFSGGDVLLDPPTNSDGEETYGPISYLSDNTNEPLERLELQEREHMATYGVQAALEVLDARSRHIIEERWLKVNDDGSGGATLHALGAQYGISHERIRQIEVAGLKKMREALT